MKVRRVKRLTASPVQPQGEMRPEPAELAPEIAQVIELVAEILLAQRRKQAHQQTPVEAA